MNKRAFALLALSAIGALLLLAACGGGEAIVVEEETPTITRTPRPTRTPGPTPTVFVRPTVEARGIPEQAGVGSLTDDLGSPLGFLAIDKDGVLYVTEYKPDGRVLKVSQSGEVEPVGTAQFECPFGIAAAGDGALYVSADSCDGSSVNAIYKIAPDGQVLLLAGSETEKGLVDGKGNAARFNRPAGLALGDDGTLYVADYGNFAVRAVNASGDVFTYAGTGTFGYADGPVTEAQFAGPISLTFSPDKNLYVTTGCDGCDPVQDLAQFIRVISPDGTVGTYSGNGTLGPADGPHSLTQFNQPAAIVFTTDEVGYVADTRNNCIRRLKTSFVLVYTSVCRKSDQPGGSVVDGKLANATFSWPVGMVYDGNGHLFVSEYGFQRIRAITLKLPEN
jgi:sugar lactone lactonase YvrE